MNLVEPFAPRRGTPRVEEMRGGDLAIDPGACTGWALFGPGLVACGTGAPPYEMLRGGRVVIELPQVYPSHPVPPNDLITLAFLAGRYAGAADEAAGFVSTVSPHAWKGNLPKSVCHARIRSHLSTTEVAIVEACDVPAKQLHNVWDAIGIGLFAFRGIKL